MNKYDITLALELCAENDCQIDHPRDCEGSIMVVWVDNVSVSVPMCHRAYYYVEKAFTTEILVV